MLPRVILHNAVSVDGRVDWFNADIGKFYELAGVFKEDATLAGADTLAQAYPEEKITPDDEEAFEHSKDTRGDTRPFLVIPDSRGRLRHLLHMLRHEPYWRDDIVLVSRKTPQTYMNFLQKRNINYIQAGEDHVDYKQALEELNSRYGIKIIRVDSGGTLNGILLRSGLVDEVSLLIHPCLVGGTTPRSMFRAPDLIAATGVIDLQLIHFEQLAENLIWLRYRVKK